MKEVRFIVWEGDPVDVHGGTLLGAFRLRRNFERSGLDMSDTAVVLRGVADEIDRLKMNHPNGRIGDVDIKGADFAISLAAAVLPTQVEQTMAIGVRGE